MNCEARLRFAAPPTSVLRATLEAALTECGCVLGQSLAAPVIAFFDSDIDEALGVLRREVQTGADRILLVTLANKPLPPLHYFQLMKQGAADVLTWDACGNCAASIAARLKRWCAVSALVNSDVVRRTLVGCSLAWQRILHQVVEVAAFGDSPVLVTGETGTGKELVARLVHELDASKNKGEFVVLDCSTVVKELSGSEFFGHEKGAFTGAAASRNGAFALANDGTLFLDELGELPLPLQAELLRVVQEQTYKRVGGSVWQTTRFRLVSATNRKLERECEAGRFRADLLYRIAGWTVCLPPLRERREDIVPLIKHFIALRTGTTLELEPPVRDYLMQREFPGNIRELRQLAGRIAQRHVGLGPVSIGDLGDDLQGCPLGEETWCDQALVRSIEKAVALGVGLKEIGRTAEDIAVRVAVQTENGSLQNAARRLGVTDRALQLRRAQQRGAEPVVALESEYASERAS